MRDVTKHMATTRQLSFSPDEVIAGLQLLFPETFADIKVDIESDVYGEGDGSIQLTWVERPLADQVKLVDLNLKDVIKGKSDTGGK